jgi:cobalt-zinc-cadmium efflux system outer membrane protein
VWPHASTRAQPAPRILLPVESAAPATASLTLEQVLAIAREHNPTFAEFAANLERARAEILIAAAYPNPEVEFYVGRARTREAPTERATEYEVGLMQTIEMPGKRRTRRVAAQAGVAVAEREREGFRATLRAEVAKAYYTVCHRMQAETLAAETAAIATDLETIVRRRFDGGETAEIDAIRARLEALKARRRIQDQRRQLAGARIALDNLCGGALPPGFVPTDPLPSDPKALESRSARDWAGFHHPELRRLDAEIARQEAIIARERTAWHPDLKPGVSAGRELDTEGYGVSLGVEIPLWNRNRGGIAAASAELNRLRAERERTRLEIDGELRMLLEEDANARERLAAFDATLREGAAEALRIETLLYRQGEHDLLQLLDARRTAQETDVEYLHARYDAAVVRIELERTMGIEGEEQ